MNKIVPLWHWCLSFPDTCNKMVQFYCPSCIYPKNQQYVLLFFFQFLQDNNVPIQENEQETNNQNNENENENKVTEIFNELNPEEEEDDTIIQCDLCPTPKIFKFDGVSRKTAESKLERHIQKFHPTESNNANSGGVYGFGKLDFQPVCRHCGAKNPTARHDCYLTIVNK